MRKSGLLVAGVLLIAGCFSVEFNVDTNVDGELKIGLGKLSSDCAGEDPNISYERVEGGCKISIKSWHATLVDTQMIKDKVNAKIVEKGKDPSDVSISLTGLKLTENNISLTDGNGINVTPPQVMAFDANIDLDGVRLLTFAGQQLQQLLVGQQVVILTPEQVAKIDAAYDKATPVEATGKGSITIPTASLLEMSMHDDLTLTFKFHIDIGATGATDAI
jgi:hypothetical protein